MCDNTRMTNETFAETNSVIPSPVILSLSKDQFNRPYEKAGGTDPSTSFATTEIAIIRIPYA
jgi:hypothetical protein